MTARNTAGGAGDTDSEPVVLSPELFLSYAKLLLAIGLDFEPGSVLAIDSGAEEMPLAQALAREAYQQGARYVDVWYWDPYTRAARIEYADEGSLTDTPAWLRKRYEALAQGDCSYLRLVGAPQADFLHGLDPRRIALETTGNAPERFELQFRSSVEWTVAACPSHRWASQVFGEPAVGSLWQCLQHFTRLDHPDPILSWRQHVATLEARANTLNHMRLDSVRFEGPGTNLTVGLLPESRWVGPMVTSRRGRQHVCNMPTEEVYTTPDPTRADGIVRAARPIVLGGTIVDGLKLKFAGGQIQHLTAKSGIDVVRASIARDPGARRLGEVALVDGSSPIAVSKRIFFATLIDENAGSHLAWGRGIPHAISGFDATRSETLSLPTINHSAVHQDFIVGDPELTVVGIGRDGQEHLLAERNRLTV